MIFQFLDSSTWASRCLYKDLGFIHIPRTGGTYLSKKMLLGIFDPLMSRSFAAWHKNPSDVRHERRAWFTIVRNPYERIASEMSALRKTANDLSLMSLPEDGHFCLQVSLSRHADILIRHENLPSEMNEMLARLNLPAIDFSDWKPKKRNVEESVKKIIRSLYSEDFEGLGYLP